MRKITEEECWFVIGAHQAGASERQCSQLSGLSKTSTHNILQNFKKLGSPHASKLSINTLLTKQNKHNKGIPRKRGRPRNPVPEPFFTHFLLSQALIEARKQHNKNSPYAYPLERPNTPPTEQDQFTTTTTDSLKLGTQRESQEDMDDLPLTPGSNLTLDESDDEIPGNCKQDNWSLKDDKELLIHVLGLPLNHIKWKHVEKNFQDRHLANLCADRWDYLKEQLLKDIHNIVL